MTPFALLTTVMFLLLAVVGALVVLTRDPRRQLFVAGIQGLLLAVLFYLLHAPDVALAEIAVGSVAVPMLVLFALVKLRDPE